MNKFDYFLVGVLVGFSMCMITLIITGVVVL